MKTILVPVDFSAVTPGVTRFARRMAKLTGSRVVLLHVVQVPIIVDPLGMGMESMAQAVAIDEKVSSRRLKRLAASFRREGFEVRSVCQVGGPVSIVLTQATRLRADLIVLGSHGRGAVYDLLVGSTAQGVLRRATCPVVVVPSRENTSRRPRR